MIRPLLDFARRNMILFGTAKFAAGLVIGFALGVYFLPILTEEKGLDTVALAQLEVSAERSGTFTATFPAPTPFTGARERSGPAIRVSGWRAKSRRDPIIGCI